MRSNPTVKLLNYLEKNKSKTLKKNDLIKQLESFTKYASQALSLKYANRKSFKKKFQSRDVSHTKLSKSNEREEYCDKILKVLHSYKVLEIEKNKITINKNLRLLKGRLTLSSRGFAFVNILGAKKNSPDVFIPQRLVNRAFNGDLVLIQINNFFQERFEGEVVEVLERARQTFRMQVKSITRSNHLSSSTLAIGNLLDTGQAKLQACINLNHINADTKAKIKVGTNIIVKVLTEKEEINFKGIYLFKANFVKIEEDNNDKDFDRILIKYDLSKIYPNFFQSQNLINSGGVDSSLAKSRSSDKYENQPSGGVDRNSEKSRSSDKYENQQSGGGSGVVGDKGENDKNGDYSNNTEIFEINEKTITDWKNRKDLRNLYTITIDGAYSKDFDDAISLQIINSKKAILYVHIADVSYYVSQNSELDLEAQKRGTSYYLANKVIPMLPKVLSEKLCSLIANVNRLTLTAEIEVSLIDGAILNSKFYRSIIKVNERLTYGQAEEFIDSSSAKELSNNFAKLHIEDENYLSCFVRKVWELAKVQRTSRLKKGRIDLVFPEPSLHYDNNNNVEKVNYKKRLKSSILIEECMLSANIAVATFLKHKKISLLNRNHEIMDVSKLESLNAFCKIYNLPIHLKDTSYKTIEKAIFEIQNHTIHAKEKVLSQIFQIMLLRSFYQAFYSPVDLGHWGLGLPHYCHFTSPIRRYPDLIVHRMLISAISKEKSPYSFTQLEAIGQKNSESERKAMDAERDILKLKLMRYLEAKRIRSITGFINGIKPDKIFIELDKIPLEATILVDEFKNSGGVDIKDNYTIFIKKLGKNLLLGNELDLIITQLDFENIQVYCKPSFLID